jgi:hypothetical protein
MENNKMKNATLLPNYDGNDEIKLKKSEEYVLKVARKNGKLIQK